MTEQARAPRPPPYGDAACAAALLAIDPGLGGVQLRCAPGPARDLFLHRLRLLLPPNAPFRKLPAATADDRLLGGLDLAATLAAGRPIVQRGLLAEADGGTVVLAMAERLPPAMIARLAAVMDRGAVALERDGIGSLFPTRFAVLALDEGIGPEEGLAASLRDRLAFALDEPMLLNGLWPEPALIEASRERLPEVTLDDGLTDHLCRAALALGITSLRAALQTARAARAAAAMAGRNSVTAEDAHLAARLVLAPRAVRMTVPEQEAAAPAQDTETLSESAGETSGGDGATGGETVAEAASAVLPPALLAGLDQGAARTAGGAGKAGTTLNLRRGAPAGTRPGSPRGARLALIDTLRAAAPWQRLRRMEDSRRVIVRSEDFRIRRFRERARTVAIFVVDASGSAALNRLAEAKGAIQLLLAECYARRDQVALLAFRGAGAACLLPPTGALARARRSLAALPGGGGTPLAAGLDAARSLALSERRKGNAPLLILLTDGAANIGRDGKAGRRAAEADAAAAAEACRAAKLPSLLVDIGRRPRPFAGSIADAMAARYLPLPHADAAALGRAVKAGRRIEHDRHGR